MLSLSVLFSLFIERPRGNISFFLSLFFFFYPLQVPCNGKNLCRKRSFARSFKLPFLFHFSSVLLDIRRYDDRYVNRRFVDSRPVFSPHSPHFTSLHQSSNVQNDIDATRDGTVQQSSQYAFSERIANPHSLPNFLASASSPVDRLFFLTRIITRSGFQIRVSLTNMRLYKIRYGMAQ